MIFMSFMRLDNLLKVICISIIFLYACTSNQLTNTADSCIIFDQKKNWYKSTKKSYDYLLTPVIAGSIVVVLFGVIINKFILKKKYPK